MTTVGTSEMEYRLMKIERAATYSLTEQPVRLYTLRR